MDTDLRQIRILIVDTLQAGANDRAHVVTIGLMRGIIELPTR